MIGDARWVDRAPVEIAREDHGRMEWMVPCGWAYVWDVDARGCKGWREKDHRKHIEGDYRSPPPPGLGAGLHDHNEGLLKRPPVHLTPAQRQVGGQAMVEMLLHEGVELLALSLDAVHYHLLARFRDSEVRPRVGRAKKHAYFVLREQGHFGEVWTKLSKVTPIKDRQHQINTFNYVRDHGLKGAWVWTFRDGLQWTPGIPGYESPR